MVNDVVYWQDVIPSDGVVKRELFFNGNLFGYYYESAPYRHRNAFVNSGGENKLPSVGSIYRCLRVLGQMNMDVDNLLIAASAQKYLSKKTLGVFNINEEFMVNQIDLAKSQQDSYWVDKRYQWLGMYDRETIMKVVQSNSCDIKKKKMIDIIRGGIEILQRDGEFITAKLLSEATSKRYKQVLSYVPIFKEEIDLYNKSMFGTCDFKDFSKSENTESIRRVINEFGITNKRKIAKLIGIHYNTVGNLWGDAFN